MAGKAKVTELEDLHKKVSNYYMDALDCGDDISSGTLNAINTFLKQNEVVVDRRESDNMSKLTTEFAKLIKSKDK